MCLPSHRTRLLPSIFLFFVFCPFFPHYILFRNYFLPNEVIVCTFSVLTITEKIMSSHDVNGESLKKKLTFVKKKRKRDFLFFVDCINSCKLNIAGKKSLLFFPLLIKQNPAKQKK